MGERPLRLPGVAGGHGELDAAHADADLGADLEELEADGAAGGGGELGSAGTAGVLKQLTENIGGSRCKESCHPAKRAVVDACADRRCGLGGCIAASETESLPDNKYRFL